MNKKIWQHKNFLESLKAALTGISFVLIKERNSKIMLALACLALAAGIYYKITRLEFMIVIFSIVLVGVCEIFNTVVENILDIVNPQHDPHVKILKDLSAAAVLTASIGAFIIGIIIFLPKIIF